MGEACHMKSPAWVFWRYNARNGKGEQGREREGVNKANSNNRNISVKSSYFEDLAVHCVDAAYFD